MALALTPDELTALLRSVQTPPPVKHFSHCTARFNGVRSPEVVKSFLTAATVYKDTELINDENALLGLSMLLEGQAFEWWESAQLGITTWREATDAIKNEYAPTPPAHQIYLDVFNAPQDHSTPTGLFVSQKRALLSMLNPIPTEETQIDMLYGLLRSAIKDRMARSSIISFKDLLLKAREVEQKEPPTTNWGKKTTSATENTKERCSYCNNRGHRFAECRKRLAAPDRSQANRNGSQGQGNATEPIRCYGCQRPGVIRRKCPTCNPTTAPVGRIGFCLINQFGPKHTRPAIKIRINGEVGTAYVDTGAHASIASVELQTILEKQGNKFHRESMALSFADGIIRQLEVKTTVATVEVKGRRIDTTFLAIPSTPAAQTLLGVDFIRQLGMVIDMKHNRWHISGSRHENYLFAEKDETPRFTENISYTNVATPRDETIRAIFDDVEMMDPLSPIPDTPVHQEWPINDRFYGPPPPGTNIADAWAIARAEATMVDAARVSNRTCHGDHQSHKNNLFETPTRIIHLAMITVPRFDTETAISAPDRNPEEEEALNQLLNDFNDRFQEEGPPTDYATHHVDTGDHLPIASPPYRLSPGRKEALHKEISILLENQVIEECESAWTAPVVMVPKPDGGTRLCIDYRKLNAITKPDHYPLPRIDDLLQATALGTQAYISTMDLRAGYYQVRMNDSDKDKTGFVTPFGTYRFNRMPFGLRNAPATFQRLMDRFRQGLGGLQLLVYLDDLILVSSSFEKHLEELRLVFERMRVFNLLMNQTKCKFGCEEVKYLGHLITPAGIRPDPEKIRAISAIPAPRTLAHLISFLQTCSWYRRFIPQFADTAKPLSQLTKKNAIWEWAKAQEDAFQALKEALTSAPVLRQADPSQPYILRTDASAYAIGAALLQGEGVEERPIEYASRLLTPPERNYSTTEREALAVVWAVNKFRGYVEETSTIVITDHQPLKWLMTLKSPSGRLARWALQLQPYDLQIAYTPGKANVLADTLSRPPCDAQTAGQCGICVVTVELPRKSAGTIREEQMSDPDLAKIIQCLDQDTPERTSQWTSRGYLLSNGVLYRYTQEDDNEEAQLVVPSQNRVTLLREYHDASTAGHYGVERTHNKIAQQFYWPRMYRDIQAYVKNCTACQRYKASNQKPAGLIQTPPMRRRFETVSIDLFGPLPPGPDKQTWVLIVEDVTSRWVELFALKHATATACATTLVNEVFLRYGLPRSIITDNGTQFISAVMQQVTYCLNIEHHFTPVYHPAANPVERKNRDLKTQLAIQLPDDHTSWPDKLSTIRFAMNSAKCSSTGYTAAYLTFGRELRTPFESVHDLRTIVQGEMFIHEITPFLETMAETLYIAKETHEQGQDARKNYADRRKRPSPIYASGDRVLVHTHPLSQKSKNYSAKFAAKNDGPFVVLQKRGPCSYEIATLEDPTTTIGTYHSSALTPFTGTGPPPAPVRPLRRRGRPRKLP